MLNSHRRRTMIAPALASLVLALLVGACGTSATVADPNAADQAGNAAVAAETAAAPGAAVNPEAATATDGSADEGSVLLQEGGLCQLLPLDEVEKALGATAVEAEADESSLSMGHTCRVTANEETILDVNRGSEETLGEFKEAFQNVGLDEEEVAGLGEFAYRASGTALGGPGTRLAVYTGERHISVTVYAEGDQATIDAAAAAIVSSLLEQGL